MAIYEVEADEIRAVPEALFADLGVRERSDLQRLLRDQVGVVAPETMVLAEEFGQWEDSRRRIDLLALDKAANLIVIELKRTEDGGFMDLQAVRYAAMVTRMTFDQAVGAHQAYMSARGLDGDAREAILTFLGWEEPDEDQFAQEVRIVLVSAEFSKELTTAVMFLNERDLDIRCVRLRSYSLEGRTLLDVQQVLPLPEAADYQIKLREKAHQERRQRRESGKDLTKFDVTISGQTKHRLAKRRAILLVVKQLCQQGAPADRISELLSWRSRASLWRSASGTLDRDQFVEAAARAAEAGGPAFEKRRWHVEDDELIVWGERTWALTKMWGERTQMALDTLLKAFSNSDVSVRPSPAEELGEG